ncbi:DsrE family protein [Nocardioides sp.]|uniref:DsrE family protein n=1 Tax=Nocardioides sp. TaxID=35761 RepID=UPI00262D808F|nr:DsrE family protein [Nocardioides sp.]MDI6912382.1 DsrE family protein [Nocardioides sp.]
MSRHLVVKVTCGADDPERANQALTVAAMALSAGAEVSLWLTGEAAWLGAGRGGFVLPEATPAADLVAAVLAGGRVTVCTQCAARREIGAGDLLEGVRIAGAAAYVEEVLAPDAQALVY